MRFFPKEAWRSYASLLIVFFALAALAVWHTLGFLENHLSGHVFHNAAFRIWGNTFGFMFITGAFGLWAIQFSAEVESLRRVGQLVDSMDYLQDGLVAIDMRGRITGSNPAIGEISESRLSYQKLLSDVFPCLSQDDIGLFVNNNDPQEIERDYINKDETKTLRFRSQPSDGMVLILVSDVTSMSLHHSHLRQTAQLQLIGQIAKGVAHDFNNILCVISGHASILKRLPPDSPELHNSIHAIIENTERGTSLAGHLIELSRQGSAGLPTDMSHEYVKSAITLLHESISSDWTIETDIQPMPVVPLTGIQIEQVVLNLGMLAADTLNSPETILISTGKLSDMPNVQTDKKYAAIILIKAQHSENHEKTSTYLNTDKIESGVILSVIQSLLDEAGCNLEHRIGSDGSFEFQVSLPPSIITANTNGAAELSSELEEYISNWTILIAASGAPKDSLTKRMDDIGCTSITVDNITSTLAHIEEDVELDAIILDETLLSQEVRGLLKAIIKIRPSAGLVVLCDSMDSTIAELTTNVVFESKNSCPNKILTSMIEARNLAIRRK